MTPGTHRLTAEEYHSDLSAVSNSQLEAFEIAPRVYQAKYLTKEIEDDDTSSLEFGRQFHELILEPKIFEAKYFSDSEIYLKYPNRTRKNYKDAFKEYALQFEGREMIKHANWIRLQGMKKSLDQTIASKALSVGDAEITVCWVDEKTGLLCKGKLDFLATWMNPKTGEKIPVILDVKTTRDAHPNRFPFEAWKYKYYRKAAFYLRGTRVATGIPYKKFAIIAIEKEPPYLYKFFEIPEAWIWSGDKELDDLLKRFKQCKETNNYPGHPRENEFEIMTIPENYIRWYQDTYGVEEE